MLNNNSYPRHVVGAQEELFCDGSPGNMCTCSFTLCFIAMRGQHCRRFFSCAFPEYNRILPSADVAIRLRSETDPTTLSLRFGLGLFRVFGAITLRRLYQRSKTHLVCHSSILIGLPLLHETPGSWGVRPIKSHDADYHRLARHIEQFLQDRAAFDYAAVFYVYFHVPDAGVD